MEPKQKQYPVVDGTDDRSKVWCCKEQYCIGTWNVRSLNQGKLEVVKQEMARVNIDILGISELRWTGKGEFNSDDHFICYCGQESLRRNGVAIMVNEIIQNAVLPPLGHSNTAVLEVEAAWIYKGLQCAWVGLRDGVGWACLEMKLRRWSEVKSRSLIYQVNEFRPYPKGSGNCWRVLRKKVYDWLWTLDRLLACVVEIREEAGGAVRKGDSLR